MTTPTTRKTHPRRRPAKPKATTTAPSVSPALPKADPSRDGGERTVTLAVVAGAHGLGGEVRLKLFAEDLGAYRSFNGGALTLRSYRNGIARFEEVADRTAAEALRGTELTVPREMLPALEDGEYYHADLIGLPVVTPDDGPVGRVVLVENFGAGDVLEIEQPSGARFMVPMRPEAVPEWDASRLVLSPDYLP